MADRSVSSADARQERVLQLVREQGQATVEELSEALSASRETIRRDLKALAAAGALRKYHGGAMAPVPEVEGSFKNRLAQAVTSKRRIAHAALSLFSPGDTLFIDTGSTTLLFAEALKSVPDLTLVTNSAAIAQVMSNPVAHARVFLLGGEYRNDNQQTVGSMAITQIRSFHLRHAVLTVAAVSLEGHLMDFSFEESEIARAMIGQAAAVTVLADRSKIGLAAPFEICRFKDIGTFVTDEPLATGLKAIAARTAVNVLVAGE